MARQDYPVGDTVYGQLVQAGKPLPTRTRNLVWFYYEVKTVSTTVTSLTYGIQNNADFALITVESNPINFILDGLSVPSTTVGHNLIAGSSFELENNHEINNFRMIRSGGSDATVKISYGRWEE